ncbi:MAG: hypothetical protein K0R84_1981 [Clostridia bacterium]|nr:hypothetical protein [Clostridia bacterium]
MKAVVEKGDNKMRDFGEDTAYFVYYAKLPEDMSAAHLHKLLGVGFLINTKTGIVEDMMVTLLSDLCKEFLRYLIVGHNIREKGIEDLIKKVESRYFGYSQKAVIVGIKGVYDRYLKWQEKENLK